MRRRVSRPRPLVVAGDGWSHEEDVLLSGGGIPVAVVGMVPSVQRGRCIREYLVVTDVVAAHPIEFRSAGIRNDHWRTSPQITKDRNDRDIYNIIPKTTAIRPAARDRAIAE